MIPFQKALAPSCLNMSPATLTTRLMAVSPSTRDARWIRVLIVSILSARRIGQTQWDVSKTPWKSFILIDCSTYGALETEDKQNQRKAYKGQYDARCMRRKWKGKMTYRVREHQK